jgi:tartrate-resistant acid phosphatase type 5
MNKKRVSLLLAGLVLAIFISSCTHRFEGAVAYVFPQLSGYKSARVINAQPIGTFITPERIADSSYLEFFAVGCAGSGNRGQKILAENMAALAEKEKISFVLYLGDNFYPYGVKSITDKQWKTKFEDMYHHKSLEMPFYAILGNHDYRKNEEAQVEYTQVSKKWRMPARYYQFSKTLADSTRIDFFAIDTELMVQGLGETQLAWLKKELKASPARWKIVAGHRPLYSGDWRHGRETEPIKKILEPILKDHKVDLYLSAHSHNMEIFKPIDGLSHVVSGAGSRPRDIFWGENTLFASAEIGYAYLRISHASIDVFMMGMQNEVDYAYRIEK